VAAGYYKKKGACRKSKKVRAERVVRTPFSKDSRWNDKNPGKTRQDTFVMETVKAVVKRGPTNL